MMRKFESFLQREKRVVDLEHRLAPQVRRMRRADPDWPRQSAGFRFWRRVRDSPTRPALLDKSSSC